MLHWRRKTQRRLRRQFFWSKLLLVSGIGHVLFLFLVLFVRKGDYFSYHVVVNKKALSSGAPVIFLPFHKVVKKKPVAKVVQPKKNKKSTPKKTTVAKSKSFDKLRTGQTKLAANKKKKPAVKKTQTKKVVQKKTKKPEKKVQTVASKTKPKKVATASIKIKFPTSLTERLVVKILTAANSNKTCINLPKASKKRSDCKNSPNFFI